MCIRDRHVGGDATTNITGGSVINNQAANEGGGLWNGSGIMTIIDVVIDGNSAHSTAAATSGGGGIYNEGGTVTTDATTQIINNIATVGPSGSGGGILNVNGGILSVTDTDILGNSASRAGGGIEDNSTVDLGDGALVGSVTLFGVQLNNNFAGSAPGNGGGLHLTGGADSNITSSVINGNTASNEGLSLIHISEPTRPY